MIAKDELEKTLTRYANTLVKQDAVAARSYLSTDFRLHEGRNAEEFIAHEINEFAERIEPYRLKDGVNARVIDLNQETGDIYYLVYNKDGMMIYEEHNRINQDLAIIGNQHIWELITKLKFRKGRDGRVSHSRGLCVRQNHYQPQALIVHSHVVEEYSLMRCEYETDSYVCEFGLAADTGNNQLVDISIFGDQPASRERRKIKMRGYDHLYFRPDLFPRIDGKSVQLPAYDSQFWSMSITFSDGTHKQIYHPKQQSYFFDKDVEIAIVVDAVDNDWIVEKT